MTHFRRTIAASQAELDQMWDTILNSLHNTMAFNPERLLAMREICRSGDYRRLSELNKHQCDIVLLLALVAIDECCVLLAKRIEERSES